MEKHLKGYHFDRAAEESYSFFWDKFCAYYVEMSKPTLFGKRGESKNKQKVLTIVLLAAIRMMHPIAPFITEEIFHLLKGKFTGLKPVKGDPYTEEAIAALLSPACTVAPYPKVVSQEDISQEVEETFAFMNEVVYAIRHIRAEMQLPPSAATDVILEGKTDIVQKHSGIIEALVKVKKLSFNPKESPIGFTSSAAVKDLKIIIPLPEEFAEKERTRLAKEKEKLEKQISSLKNQLSNPHFIERAPQELVEKTKAQLEEAEKRWKTL
jgi:valyl-tRNA synthetase